MKQMYTEAATTAAYCASVIFGPILLKQQELVAFAHYTLLGDSLDFFLGALLMIVAVGGTAGLWLWGGEENPRRMSGRQWTLSAVVLLLVGYGVSFALSYLSNISYVLRFQDVSDTTSDYVQYGTPMVAVLLATWALKRLYIQGDNGVASWGRRRTKLPERLMPRVREGRPLPTSHLSSTA